MNESPARHPPPVKPIGFAIGIALLLMCLVTSPPEGMSLIAWRTAGVGMMMAAWWATEALPIAATALVPAALFPLLGITDGRGATYPYASPLIFLFLGGFMIAIAMERWNLHRRIALNIVSFVGTRPQNIVLGFMLATALLSMWISNTATTMMMLPIGTSVTAILISESSDSTNPRDHKAFAICLMLGIAYAASIGGVGTLIGSPTNLAMAAILLQQFGIEIGMLQWTALGLPFVVVMLPAAWWCLTRIVYRFDLGESDAAASHVAQELNAMGRISVAEKRVAMIAGLVAVAWVTRGVVDNYVPGLSDPVIAMLGTLALFIMPNGNRQAGNGVRLMNWEATAKIPWGLILLFGGGLSLAAAMASSGLALWISEQLSVLSTWPLIWLTALIVAVIVYLTELTSNAATTAAFVPVIGALAIGIGIDPIVLAAPAAIAASCAFMLPVATPPNAIVFGSGYLTTADMIKGGFWLNLISIVVITGFALILLPLVFGT